MRADAKAIVDGSPVSDDGRGLKHGVVSRLLAVISGSPVSDDGRGLKLVVGHHAQQAAGVRPSAMTGVD